MDIMQQIYLGVLVLLLLLGLVLAFAGRWVFESLMSFLGALIGAVIGFQLGYYTFGWGCFGGLILCVIGALVGGLIFHYIVEFAIALFCGLLAGVVVFAVLGSGQYTIFITLIVIIVVGVLSWYFIREIIGVVTALMGGMISGYALLQLDILLNWNMHSVWILLTILIVVVGAIVQVKAAGGERKGTRPEKKSHEEPSDKDERKTEHEDDE